MAHRGKHTMGENTPCASFRTCQTACLRYLLEKHAAVFGGENGLPNGNTGLARLLARAHSIRRCLFDDRMTIGEVAQAKDLIPSYVTRLVRLTFLAPDITGSMLSGRHDPDLTVSRLMADTRFPLDWSDQRLPRAQRRLTAS